MKWAGSVIGACWLLGATAARAADTDELQSLLSENVITTASTTAERATTAPATSVTLTSDDFERYGIRSVDEAINFLAVGMVTSDPLRTPDIGARGVLLPGDNGKHVLVLVNGHALNDPLYGIARVDQGLGIPLDLVDRVEVVIGPGSVLYGSSAMLGVINVITKSGGTYQGGHALAEFEPGRSVRASAGGGHAFTLGGIQGELTAAAQHYERFGPDLEFTPLLYPPNGGTGRLLRFSRGGPEDGLWGGTVQRAYFKQAPSGMLRLRLGEFEVSVMGSAYRRGIPYSTGGVNVDFDDPDSFEMDRALRVDVKHQTMLGTLVDLTSRAYADTFDFQRKVNREATAGCFRGDMQTCTLYDAGLSRWAGVEERASFNWLKDASFVTMVGVDMRMRWVRAKEDSTDFATGKPFAPTTGLIRESAGIVSPYVQQTWSPSQWLDVNAGARLDADARFNPILSPRGAVAVSPSRKTTIRGVYSQAFRAPTWDETSSAGTRQAPSNVTPEHVHSFEGSFEQRLSTQRLMIGAFHTTWDAMIAPHVLSAAERSELQEQGVLPIIADTVIQYRNVSSIENWGMNGSWNGSSLEGKLSYGLNVTEAYTRQKTEGGASAPLTVAPQTFGNVHASYAAGGLAPVPALALSYVGTRPADRAFGNGYVPIPYAPPLAVVRATVTGPVPGVRGLSYRLSASYSTTGRAPYMAGMVDSVDHSPRYVPVDRFNAFFGLRYDFGGDSASSQGGGS